MKKSEKIKKLQDEKTILISIYGIYGGSKNVFKERIRIDLALNKLGVKEN